MEKPPFCLVTCAGPRIIEELELLVSSFRQHNPGIPILCIGENMQGACKRLAIEWMTCPADFDFCRDSGRLRSLGKREALRRAPWALYCDADVLFTAPIPADTWQPGLQVLLSEHYVDAVTAAKWGRFNSGYIATCDPAFTEWWPWITAEHPELISEQKPLEFAPTRFKCGTFHPGHNVGFWRMACLPGGFEERWTRNGFDGWPVVSVHGHLKNYGGRPGQGYNFFAPFVDLVNQRVRGIQTARRARNDNTPAPRLVLYVPWYRAKDAARQAEIDEATRRNLEAGADEVVLLVEPKDRGDVPEAFRARIEKTEKRQTFADVYALAARRPGTVAVWINADAYVAPGALDMIRQRDMRGLFLCITRWDGGVLEGSAWGCHDAWAVLADEALVGQDTDLAFGTPGIDHCVNGRMKKRGYTPRNPCYEVRVQHLHESGKRDYPPTIYGDTLYVWHEEDGVSVCSEKVPKGQPWKPQVPKLVQIKDARGNWQIRPR